MPDNGEVLGGILCSQAGFVLAERHVENPVQLVLDLPVTTNGRQRLLGCHGRARSNEVPASAALLSVDDARGLEEYELCQPLPTFPQLLRKLGGDRQHPALARLLSTSFLLCARRVVLAIKNGIGIAASESVQCVGDGLGQLRLVVPNSEQIVSAFLHDFLGDVGLTARSVDCDETALEVQQLQQAWDGLDFIRSLCRPNLAEDDAVRGTPSADHRDESAAARLLERPSQDLPIDRDNAIIRRRRNAPHPGRKHGLERFRVELREDAADGIVGGNPRRKLDEALKKFQARVSESLDSHRVIRAAHDSAQAQEQHRLQAVSAGPLHSRVRHLRKQLDERVDVRRWSHRGLDFRSPFRTLGSRRHPSKEITFACVDANHAATDRNCLSLDAIALGIMSTQVLAYKFSEDRGASTANELIGDSAGYLTVDGYSGYNNVTEAAEGESKRTRVGCWGHARRKFYAAMKNVPTAREVLEMIVELYVVERDAAMKGVLGTDAHAKMRKEQSAAIVERIEAWVDEQHGQHSPKSAMGSALTYAKKQRTRLRRFLEDPKLALDNNYAERALRIIALGRKNFLFAGSAEHAQNLAVLQSIVSTCLLHDVNPYEYIRDVIVRLRDRPPDPPLSG